MNQRVISSVFLCCLAAGCDPSAPDPETPVNSDGTAQVFSGLPEGHSPTTLVLPYDAFGPQAMAGTLLGAGWYQWEPGGSFEIGDSFDVRVVIYHGVSRASVEAEYPTVKGDSDFRYVEYADALRYFDAQIAELVADPDPSLASLLVELRSTRDRIASAL